MKILKILSAVIFVFAIGLLSCKKKPAQTPYKKTHYSVRLTDAPGPYSAVNINLQGVEIKSNGNETILLNINSGMYNLLHFANGLDTLIATGDLNVTKVSQIRLILGPGNTVVKNGITYPLATPSAEESGLKLQVHQNLEAGVAYEVLLDFDANQSIVENGNGSYSLKPVIRTIENAISGSISGTINPIVVCSVSASSGGITYSSQCNANGQFVIKGLPAGAYSLTATPVNPYSPQTINTIQVTVGSTKNVGIINL